MSGKQKTVEEWEDELLSLPLANSVSGEHEVHTPDQMGYVAPTDSWLAAKGYCACKRCWVIRIKRRRAFRFSRSKCPGCGTLFTSLFTHCGKCSRE